MDGMGAFGRGTIKNPKTNDIRLSLKLSDRSTREYISKLQKNQKIHNFVNGYQHNTQALVLWNRLLAVLAVGFSDQPALP